MNTKGYADKEAVLAEQGTTVPTVYYLVGGLNGWAANDEYKFSVNPDNDAEQALVNVSIEANTELKLIAVQGSKTTWLGYSIFEGDTNLSISGEGDSNITIGEAGTYSFYYKVKENKLWVSKVDTPSEEIINTYGKDGGEIIYSDNGGIACHTGISHAIMLHVYYGDGFNLTNDLLINIKGHVKNIYRIKLFVSYADGTEQVIISRLFDSSSSSASLTTLGNDGYFEYHGSLGATAGKISSLGFQCYMSSNDAGTGELQLLGIEFDTDGSFNDFADLYVPEHTCDFTGAWNSDANQHWHECPTCGEADEKVDHTPNTDDGDCTTAITCSVCNGVTTEGNEAHNFVDGSCSVCGKEKTVEVGKFVANTSLISISENENGEQVISHHVTNSEYFTIEAEVKNYTSKLNLFKLCFTASESVKLGIQINGKMDWSEGGHVAYPAGKQTIYLDVTKYLATNTTELPESFVVLIYLDNGNPSVNAKQITIHSISFVNEMLLSAPKADGLTCVAGENGYDISYNNDTGSWRNLSIAVNNYDTVCTDLQIKLDVPANTNLQIVVEFVDGTGSSGSKTLRSHWGSEGVVTTAGEVLLQYDLSEIVAAGNAITKIIIYFDNPTEYTTNTGNITAKLISCKLVAAE